MKDIKANLTIGNTPTVRGNLQIGGAAGRKVTDYEALQNKPSIEHVELVGDKSFEELGLENMDNMEILSIFNEVFR